MKHKVIKLSACECGFAFFRDGITLGHEYEVDTGRLSQGVLTCGGCGKPTSLICVEVEPSGAIPAILLDVDPALQRDISELAIETLEERWQKFSGILKDATENESKWAELAFKSGCVMTTRLITDMTNANAHNLPLLILPLEKLMRDHEAWARAARMVMEARVKDEKMGVTSVTE